MGFRERKRICQIGPNKESCIGKSVDKSICYNEFCNEIPTEQTLSQTTYTNKFAINGKWSEWSPWQTDCQLCKIQSNNLKRSRQCNNPSPANGGKYCHGMDTDLRPCYGSSECSNYIINRVAYFISFNLIYS